MPTSDFDIQQIKKQFYPPYIPHPVDIGHIKMYELIHQTSIWKKSYFDLVSYFRYEIDGLRVLYEQLISNWSDYERFLEEELPFMKWDAKNKFI